VRKVRARIVLEFIRVRTSRIDSDEIGDQFRPLMKTPCLRRFFHQPQDSAEETAPELLEPNGRSLVELLESLEDA